MRVFYVLCVMLLLLITGCMQNRSTMITAQEVEELKATIQHQFQAMLEADVEILERITSDDYVMTSRKGALLTKAEWIQMLVSSRLKYLDMGEQTDVSINLYGNVAVVRDLIGSTVYELDGEKHGTGLRRFTAVWVYKGGTWRQVARQHTAVESKRDQSG